AMTSSRTPEGTPIRCPVCGKQTRLEPTNPPGDAPCPHCGSLLWFTTLGGEQAVAISLGEVLVSRLHSSNRVVAIQQLIDGLVERNQISAGDRDDIIRRILHREELGSTAIGRGIAIPHCCHPNVRSTAVSCGLSTDGIDFCAVDGEKTHVVYLFVWP